MFLFILYLYYRVSRSQRCFLANTRENCKCNWRIPSYQTYDSLSRSHQIWRLLYDTQVLCNLVSSCRFWCLCHSSERIRETQKSRNTGNNAYFMNKLTRRISQCTTHKLLFEIRELEIFYDFCDLQYCIGNSILYPFLYSQSLFDSGTSSWDVIFCKFHGGWDSSTSTPTLSKNGTGKYRTHYCKAVTTFDSWMQCLFHLSTGTF